jgi:hypothetical protein
VSVKNKPSLILISFAILGLMLASCTVSTPAPVLNAADSPTRNDPGTATAIPQEVEATIDDPGEIQAESQNGDPPDTFHAMGGLGPSQDATPPVPPADNEFRRTAQPAGCLTAKEAANHSVEDMLAYADSLLDLEPPLSGRLLTSSWNAYQGEYIAYTSGPGGLSISLGDARVEVKDSLQRVLNALHVSGFVSWLRYSPDQDLHILAIPLNGVEILDSEWGEYIEAYWDNGTSLPQADPYIQPVMKLPPCDWMVSQGYAPAVDDDWWSALTWEYPDYAAAAVNYLAEDTSQSRQIAYDIDWFNEGDTESPTSMCGPLTWSIASSAGAFPPGVGAWSMGPKSFWLSDPEVDGRPWSLFPSDSYSLYHYDTRLGEFDFQSWPLYPGDMFYTYSEGSGFDHIFIITEIDEEGNVYTVSNLVQYVPDFEVTVQRIIVYNQHDLETGIFRNEWKSDGDNGRTGHGGFDVFRWAWLEKDLSGETVKVQIEPGDTLWTLGARWKTSPELIAAENDMALDSPLQLGETIRIPPNP